MKILVLSLFLLLAPGLGAQSAGFDIPTLLPFLVASDGRVVWAETQGGKVRSVTPAYKAWPYSSNPLASQALDPSGHERIVALVRKAADDVSKSVEVKWVTAPGFAGGFMIFVDGKQFLNALQVALWHIKDGEALAIDQIRTLGYAQRVF